MKKKIISLLFAFSALSASPTTVISNSLSSVVFIVQESNSFELGYGCSPGTFSFRPSLKQGSGFLITSNGYIATNHHVIEDASSILVAVQFSNTRIFKAALVGSDPRTDIAILKIETDDELTFPYLELANSNDTQPGESVIAIGNPLSTLFESSATMGIISAKERNHLDLNPIEGYLQTDAAVNPGNSGCPLLNMDGKVVGLINSAIKGQVEGINFAIPSNTLKHIAAQIISDGTTTQGFLGVWLEPSTDSAFSQFFFDSLSGARIKLVIPNSPAHKASLQADDLITSVNGYPIRSSAALKNQICILAPETPIDLTIERDGSTYQVSLNLGDEELSDKYCNFDDDILIF